MTGTLLDKKLYELLDSGTLVLTASRRLAHVVSQRYAERARAAGRKVWPTPSVLHWPAFIRKACREQRSAQLQAPTRLLSDLQAQALWERIVADSVAGQQLLNPSQAARNAAASWQRLHEYCIPLKSVAAYPSEEAQAFAAWAQAFVRDTQRHGWLDSARFCEWLLASDYVPSQPVALMGFDRLTPEMARLIEHWRTRNADVTLLSLPIKSSKVVVVAARDAVTEVQLAAQWARGLVEQGAQRVAVVVPQLTRRAADVERVFAGVFHPAVEALDTEVPTRAFTVAVSAQLSSYPLVHHALLCLRLAQGNADTLLIGQLLRSPFLVGYEAEAAVRALADIAAREVRREQWSLIELSHFAAAQQCAALAGAMHTAHELNRGYQNSALPSEWAERCSRLLQSMGWPQGRTLNSSEQQTREKLYEVLAELGSLDELLGRIDLQRALTVLRDACNAQRFAPESSDQRVTIIDAETVAGMEFDAVWVMGMHAGEWPPAIDPDPLLPIELQRQYQLPNANAAECLQAAQRRLARLTQSSDAVVLSWPQHDGDAELRPSPLLAPWPSLAAEELNLADVVSVERQQFEHRPVLEALNDANAPPVRTAQLKGGAKIFELQSRCAFRAQAQLRLHAEPLPSVTLAIEPIERGKLIHRVLDELWRELKGSAGLQAVLPNADEADTSLLTARVRDIAMRIAHHLIPVATPHRQRLVALEVELATQWIVQLLQVEAQRPPFTVQHSERSEPMKFAGMNIVIQADRVDELEDGSKLLIDYKTGVSNQPREWLDVANPGRPRSPQLPLYAMAHRENLAGIAFAILAPGVQTLRGLADGDAMQAVGVYDYASFKPNSKPLGVETWDDLLAHWQRVLNTLGQQFLNGAAAVAPLRGECDYCHLAGLCRINEVSIERDGETEQGDE